MARRAPDETLPLEDDPLWYRNAVIYQLHVRAFFDSVGDGMGDFRGLTQKLDYLQDLGVTALWLLPFYPSPLRDDGYDIADYGGVNPAYGTLRDFKRFVQEARRRGLRVITELVLNHTSDQHPWFQRARRSPPGSKWRDFYVWSDTPDRYRDARIIFKDFESSNWSFDPVAKAYYWHRFYHHQPDLNFDNPEVHAALLKALDFWLDMGVDGLRLDAIPYLYEREGTTCENLEETHGYLKQLRAHVDAKYQSRMLLAEANQWPEDTMAYFGEGDECHMAFHFPVMPRMYMALHMEDRFPLVDIMQQTPPIPDGCQWAIFLRNHDELTLEMVTDEERDYMYRVYAGDPRARINLGIRRRLAPLLDNDRRKIELMNGLLFSLPGTPILYYGDEIGMGDNIYLGDRDGVRTPMQWNADRNAGFSRANPQKLYLPVNIDPEYRYESVNVEAAQQNPSSLWWWMRRLIAVRQRHRVFGTGTLEFLLPENSKVLAFVRSSEEETVLVVANLSRFTQCAELDLAEWEGRVPRELFGRTRFPAIGRLPYFVTLGPHGFYWLSLERAAAERFDLTASSAAETVPVITVARRWEGLLKGRGRTALENLLPEFLSRRRWFGGKGRSIQGVDLLEAIPVPRDGDKAWVLLLEVSYTEGEPETYVLPVAFAEGEGGEQLLADLPVAAVARVRSRSAEGEGGVLYDAAFDEVFTSRLLEAVQKRARFKGESGELHATSYRPLRQALAGAEDLVPTVSRAEQSNTSVIYGDRLILKLFRRPGEGVNPDLEIGRFLSERARFPHVPQVVGALEYRRRRGPPRTLGILQQLVPNEGDAWHQTLHDLGRYYEQLQSRHHEDLEAPRVRLTALPGPAPDLAHELIGVTLQHAELLGRRTAELHLALASDHDDPAFAPEAFTAHYQRGLYQSVRNQAKIAIGRLRRAAKTLPEGAAADAAAVVDHEAALLARAAAVKDGRIRALRIRGHGDYHLGQVLWTGRDFVIIDFEGEPARSLSERRLKRSPLRDVAGMLRSYDYAAWAGLFDHASRYQVRPGTEAMVRLVEGARFWNGWTAAAFLGSYLEVADAGSLLPEGRGASEVLLEALLLEKAAYEVGYELDNRPDWVGIPLRGILDLLPEER